MAQNGTSALAVAAAALMVMAVPAWADCNADIQRLQSQATKISDAKTKKLVEYDIVRAKREAGENDAMECQEAVDHADKLLASPTP